MIKDVHSYISGSSKHPRWPDTRRVAIGLAFVVGVLVGIDQCAGVVLGYFYRHSDISPVYRVEQVAPETLVVGSSTANRAIDPQNFFRHTYNAAEDGQGIFYTAALLRALPTEVPIRRIVLGIDPRSLIEGFRDNNTKHLWRLGPLAEDDPILRKWLVRDSIVSEIKMLSQLFAYRSDAGPIVRRWLWPSHLGNGFVPLEGELASLPEEVFFGKFESVNIASEAGEALDVIAKEAMRLDAQLVTITIPHLGSNASEVKKFLSLFELVNERLSIAKHCDLKSTSTPALRAIAATPAFFSDGAHFNGVGARHYSNRLAQLISTMCSPL